MTVVWLVVAVAQPKEEVAAVVEEEREAGRQAEWVEEAAEATVRAWDLVV